MRRVQHQMTDSFQAHKDDTAILEPSACDAFRACEQAALRCMCSVCGCTVYTPRRFSGILSRKPTSPPLRCCRRVSLWLSVVPPFSLAIDIVVEIFSSIELLILSLTLLMLLMYRYQSLFRSRQASILHYQALF